MPLLKVKSKKYHGMLEVQCPEKCQQIWEKYWSQQIKHMQEIGNTYGIPFLRLERPA